MQNLIDGLKKIDVDKRLKELDVFIKEESNPRKMDKLVKEFKILRNLKGEGISPIEAFTRKTMPVIPATYRSPIELPDGNVFNPDMNLLLRNVGFANESLRKSKDVLSDEKIREARYNLYRSVEDLSGFNTPKAGNVTPENLFGTFSGGAKPPKKGFFQRKLTRKRQNLSGRSVISPNPNLDIDEIEVPYDLGLTMYEPFVRKELNQRGYNRGQIDAHIKNKTGIAKEVLRKIGKDRPIAANRAPSIWQGSVTGAYPIFTGGKNIATPNLLTTMQLADYDGDSGLFFIHLRHFRKGDYKKYLDIKYIFNYIVSVIKKWRKGGQLPTTKVRGLES